MCTAMKVQKIFVFENFKQVLLKCALICEKSELTKKNQMSTDVNKKYCQSCNLISRDGLSLRKERA
jgi:hypothetical protein